MTRVWSEGFEMLDLIGYPSVTAAISTTYKRSGVAGLYFSNSYFTKSITAIAEGYLRFGFYYVGGTGDSIRKALIYWRNSATSLGYIEINYLTGGFINIIIPGVGSAMGAIPIAQSTWYLIEIYIKIDDAAGVVTVKVDGVTDASYSGDTKPDANTQFNNLYFSSGSSGGVGNYFRYAIDDIGLNDTAGGVDDSWLGDGRIIVIKPNGDTATLDLTPSAAVEHYTLVDEVPADGDTTYVEGSVDDEEDIYDLTACGLTDVIITRIWTEARAKDTAVSGKSVALITLASGGAEVSGGDVVLGGTYTTKVLGTEQLVNPVDSAAWEVADIDALQGGPRTRP